MAEQQTPTGMGKIHLLTTKMCLAANLCNRLFISSMRHSLMIIMYVIQSIWNPYTKNSEGNVAVTIRAVIIIKITLQFLLITSTVFLFTAIKHRRYSKATVGLTVKILLECIYCYQDWLAQVFIRNFTNLIDYKENVFMDLTRVLYCFVFWVEMMSIRKFIIKNSIDNSPLRFSIICGVRLKNLIYVQFFHAMIAVLTQTIKVVQRLLYETREEIRHSPLFSIFQIWAIFCVIAIGLIMPDLYCGFRNKSPERIQRHLYGKTCVYILLGTKSILEPRFFDNHHESGKIMKIIVHCSQAIYVTFELLTLITYIEVLKHSTKLNCIGAEEITNDDVGAHLVINRSRLTIDHQFLLGEGFFGKVYKGNLSHRTNFKKAIITVAVKCLEYDSTQLDALLSELKALALVMKGHSNVINFYGVNFVKFSDFGHEVSRANLVLEYCEKGSLNLFLGKIRKSMVADQLDFKNTVIKQQLLDWGLQIAEGMEYISFQKMVHGDLAARNILLNSNLVAKISDFGMARKLYAYQKYATSLQTVFPWRWMAPESFAELKFSTQSDIWSFGVLLWEMFSLGIKPWTGQMWTSEFANMLKSGLRLEKPGFASDYLYDTIILNCWNLDSNHRISFSDIVVCFKHLRNKTDDNRDNLL